MKRVILLFITMFFTLIIISCKNSNAPISNEEYSVKIHYSLNEKEDATIKFNKDNLDNIRLENLDVAGYNFLGYFEENEKIEKIELKNYNLETKYEKIEYHIYINYNGIEKENDTISFNVSTLKDVSLDNYKNENKVFCGYYENGKKIDKIEELRDYNLEARFIDREILVASLFDIEVNDLEEVENYVRFDSSSYNSNVVTELNVSDWKPLFNLVMVSFEGFDPFNLTDVNRVDNSDVYYFNYFILVTNDIVNNEVVFCDCVVSDTATLIVYDNKDNAKFYEEYQVQTSDYITYQKAEKDLSKLGNSLNDYKYILNEVTKEPITELVYSFNLLYAREDDVVDKVKEFINTKKVTSSDLSIKDYFKDILKTGSPNTILRIEVKASVIVNGEKQEKTFYIDASIYNDQLK